MKPTAIVLIALALSASLHARQFALRSGAKVKIAVEAGLRPVAHTAAELLCSDLRAVFDAKPAVAADTLGADIIVSAEAGKAPQSFTLSVDTAGRLHITGGDSHGAAYGLMRLSRLIGVSPWEWWADAVPAKRRTFALASGYSESQAPSVEYRGVFINDEDRGLMPWASSNYEPAKRGVIGPKTSARIFELLLRLRANTYWPPMHECSQPFFLTAGNRETAERYGIYIGGSHCEPMASSTAGEWPRRGRGDYDYVNNAEAVREFWASRVREVAGQEILYTVGMRGVHDGAMNGAKTVVEQKAVLERVLADQRAMLRQYVDSRVERVPQVFVPYKEVLDVYRAGLNVPDDVTLMWCDDNYGYIRHFPTPAEQARSGGNGIYYHVSYWGRPHDYLWLGTFAPGLLYQQMSLAYDKGIRRMWILNVGDIKPAEYQTELFMDMAWNIGEVRRQGPEGHLRAFLDREFGPAAAKRLLPAMKEHYRLAYIRKPEHMGATRTEERDPIYKVVKDLLWTDNYCSARIEAYDRIERIAASEARRMPQAKRDAYYQLVGYPIAAASEMNKKLLYAQLARHGHADWSLSDAAYDSIRSLTRTYNEGYANGGKWRGIMDMKPRSLAVFDRVPHATCEPPAVGKFTALSPKGRPSGRIPMLGYGGSAIALPQGATLDYYFAAPRADSVTIRLCLLPGHPVSGEALRVGVTLDGRAAAPAHYETAGRSEAWKTNVLANQARLTLTLPLTPARRHRLTLTALDEGVVVDQVLMAEQ